MTARFVFCVSALQRLSWLLSSSVRSAVLWHYCHSRRTWTIVTTVSRMCASMITNIWHDSVGDIEQGELDNVIRMCPSPSEPRWLSARNCWPTARRLAYISERGVMGGLCDAHHLFLALIHILHTEHITNICLLVLNKPAGVITGSAVAVKLYANSDDVVERFQLHL